MIALISLAAGQLLRARRGQDSRTAHALGNALSALLQNQPGEHAAWFQALGNSSPGCKTIHLQGARTLSGTPANARLDSSVNKASEGFGSLNIEKYGSQGSGGGETSGPKPPEAGQVSSTWALDDLAPGLNARYGGAAAQSVNPSSSPALESRSHAKQDNVAHVAHVRSDPVPQGNTQPSHPNVAASVPHGESSGAQPTSQQPVQYSQHDKQYTKLSHESAAPKPSMSASTSDALYSSSTLTAKSAPGSTWHNPPPSSSSTSHSTANSGPHGPWLVKPLSDSSTSHSTADSGPCGPWLIEPISDSSTSHSFSSPNLQLAGKKPNAGTLYPETDLNMESSGRKFLSQVLTGDISEAYLNYLHTFPHYTKLMRVGIVQHESGWAEPQMHIDPDHYELFTQQMLSEKRDIAESFKLFTKKKDAAEQRGASAGLPSYQRLIKRWVQEMAAEIESEHKNFMRLLDKNDPVQKITKDVPFGTWSRGQYYDAGPVLSTFPPQMLASVAIQSFLNNIIKERVNAYENKMAGPMAMDAESHLLKALPLSKKMGEALLDRVRFLQLGDDIAEQRLLNKKAKKASRTAPAGPEEGQEVLLSESLLKQLDTPANKMHRQEMNSASERYKRTQAGIRKMSNLANEVSSALKNGNIHHQLRRGLALAVRSDLWTSHDQLKFGAGLLDLLVRSATVTVPVIPPLDQASPSEEDLAPPMPIIKPAMIHKVVQTKGTKKHSYNQVGAIDINLEVLKEIGGTENLALSRHPVNSPMLIEPRPWTHWKRGGHLTTSQQIIRIQATEDFKDQVRSAHESGRMESLYKGMNALGATAWKINSRMLEVVEQLVLDKESDLLGSPMEPLQELPTNPLAPSPEPSSSKNARLQKRQAVSPSTPYLRLSIGGARKGQIVVTAGAMTKEELWMFRKRVESVKRLNSELMSEQMSLVTKLKVANDFKDKPRFYLPHNIDFRGRAYPLHPNLNQLGNDFSRSLLLFADAKPLGKSGLNWLKIQLANGWGQGQDKLALDGRIAFVDQHLADVTDSATHPLDGARWWASGEKPLQVLAVCMELHQALTSPDPEKFLSSLPVHQDGTCNGLQHYAALGRDVGGATAVNLKNADKPQDVYMAVAKLVEDKVKIDAAAGLSEATKFLSRNNNAVDRKLVKQTVMTSVYGVTKIGSRNQIAKRLQERDWTNSDEIYKVSKYLANITIMSIGEVFQNAQAIMQWLGICASAVTATKRPVRWDSPLGFPIEQPYWKEKMSVVKTPLQMFTTNQVDSLRWQLSKSAEAQAATPPPTHPTTVESSTSITSSTGSTSSTSFAIGAGGDSIQAVAVDRAGQRTAFPPNYIHCLDSTHMLMTAIDCCEKGIAFAGVHDSYWTQAGTVDGMNISLREKFVELHKRPLLEMLVADLTQNAPEITLPPIPPRGELDLDVVKDSVYFFS